jgi:hypothetical protein
VAEPKIKFNSSGSDTQASGAGPGDGTTSGTALFGAATAHTSGAASTTIQLPAGTDLSNIPTDGSAAVYLATASGRRFSKITAKDDTNDTITVADSFTIAAPGVDWAIGGKRATLDHAGSRQLGADIKSGWWICIETAQSINTTTFTISSSGSTSSPGWIIVTGNSRSDRALITGTFNGRSISCTGVRIVVRWLCFDNTHATKTASAGLYQSNTTSEFKVFECKFGDATNKLWRGIDCAATPSYEIRGCEFCYLTGVALRGQFAGSGITWSDCDFHHNTFTNVTDTDGGGASYTRCRFWANSGVPILVNSSGAASITYCIFDGNGSHAVNWNGGASTLLGRHIYGNQFTNNSGYGFRLSALPTNWDAGLTEILDYNNYYNNTSGARLNLPAGAHDKAVDPDYVDRANGDFRYQNSALDNSGFSANLAYGPIIGMLPYGGSGGSGGGSDVFSSPVIR